MFDFPGKWLRFSYLRRWLPFSSWDPGLLPCGEAPLCVPSWLVSVWQKIFAFGTEKSCLPSRPLSWWDTATYYVTVSTCQISNQAQPLFSYRKGTWLPQVPLSVIIIIGPICHCSPWMQLASSVHRWDESSPATSQNLWRESPSHTRGLGTPCVLTYPHRQPFSDSTPSDSLPMIRVDWTWNSEPCYSTCAKLCCFAVG